MKRDPWTDPEPQPGDFDADLELLGPEHIHQVSGNPDAKLTRLVGVDARVASEMASVAAERGTTVAELIADVWRSSELARH